MAISTIATVKAAYTGPSTGCTTPSFDSTGATLIEVSIAGHPSATPVVTDSNGNSYARLRAANASDKGVWKFAALAPLTVGSGHTVSVSGSALYGAVIVRAYAGAQLVYSGPHAINNTGGSVTSLATGSVTPALSPALVTSAMAWGGTGVLTSLAVTAPPTLVDTVAGVASQCYGLGVAEEIQATATTRNPTWTWTGGSEVSGVTAEYYEVPAATETVDVTGVPSAAHTIGSQSSLTFSHTTNGDPLYLDVSLWESRTVLSATFNGVALGRAVTGNSSRYHEVWFLGSPGTATANIVITLASSSTWIGALARNVRGGNTGGLVLANFTMANGTSTAPSVTVTSASGDLVLDYVSTNAVWPRFTPGAGQTLDRAHPDNGENNGAGSHEVGAASVTMAWTLSLSNAWVMAGYSVPAAGTGTFSTRVSRVDVEAATAQAATTGIRVSRAAVEALTPQAITTGLRVSRVAVETVSGAAPAVDVRVTQAFVEALTQNPTADVRVTRAFVEVLSTSAAANDPPVVDAGPDQAVTLPATATMAATVTDDGLPAATLTYAWTKTSGPGTATFDDATIEDPVVTFSLAGTYVLRLTASDSDETAYDELTVEVSNPAPPTVDAGPDQAVTLPATATMAATVTSALAVTDAWTQTSGPGTATFAASAAIEDPVVTFDAPGTYVLRLTASNGYTSAYDELTVEVSLPPIDVTVDQYALEYAVALVNEPPEVYAGADRSVDVSEVIDLDDATAIDDGEPYPAELTYTWSVTSGDPDNVVWGDTSALHPWVYFLADGTYVLRLTVSDRELEAYDERTITVSTRIAPGPSLCGTENVLTWIETVYRMS